ncbi:MAG: hypothetical protein ABIH23_21700, partial [bacterium]
KKFFLNCVCYIHKFDGKKPLVRRESSHRMNVIRSAALINKIKIKEFVSTFPPNLYKKYEGDPVGLVAFYQNDYELIYRTKAFLIDRELKSLGIHSNREVSTLERLVSILQDGKHANGEASTFKRLMSLLPGGKHAETARLLLNRYTTEAFETPDEWQAWLDENKDRIYFSDVGGYKFRVVPKGYLE